MSMTMLEKYLLIRGDLEGKLASRSLTFDEIWQYQELLYRTSVLETCSMLTQMAPVSADPQLLCMHYQMLDTYIESLILERNFGVRDQDAKKRCDTAHSNLVLIVQDYRKRFGSFAPTGTEQYRKEISNVISTVLTAWIQYRETYIIIGRPTNE